MLSGWRLDIVEGSKVRARIDHDSRRVIVSAELPAADVARQVWQMVQRIESLSTAARASARQESPVPLPGHFAGDVA